MHFSFWTHTHMHTHTHTRTHTHAHTHAHAHSHPHEHVLTNPLSSLSMKYPRTRNALGQWGKNDLKRKGQNFHNSFGVMLFLECAI